MRNLALALCILLPLYFFSCTPFEEVISTDKNIRLRFDHDTVIFDTIFTSVGSITKRLKVYNPGKNALIIERISLGNEGQTPYKIIVNGMEGHSFLNQKLLGGDSLLILVSVRIDPDDENLPFLVKDSISFLTNSNYQNVKLISWGQNAHFVKGVVPCNAVWDSKRPYVIYDTTLVDYGCKLVIKEGTRIYLDNKVNFFVRGSLQIEGTHEERVLIRNSRLDKSYENSFGQWGGIYFLEGSTNNHVNYAVVRNGSIGFRVGIPDNDTIPDLIIGNTIIENMSLAGILAFNSDIYAYNTLINNCGQFLVANIAGGNYTYRHCTFANYYSFREENSVIFTNGFLLDDGSVLSHDISLNIQNSIIWGNHKSGEEIMLVNSGDAGFTIYNSHNLFKTKFDFFNSNENILNEDPQFLNHGRYDYRLKSNSPAIKKGIKGDIGVDLNNNLRNDPPSIGAYEYEEEEE